MITTELNFTQIDPVTFSSFLADKHGILIDIRTREAFEESKINHAINIDFQSSQFLKEISNYPKDTPLFLYCEVGKKSSNAMTLLKQEKFKEVYSLKGGIIAWEIAFL